MLQNFNLSIGSNPTAKGNAILRSFTGTNRAANTEVSETVPTGKVWELLAVTVSLAQGATQTPQPTLVIADGTNTIYAGLGASSAQNSSVTTRYTWAPGLTLTAGAAATVANAPLPAGLILPTGYTIATSTAGIGANSDYAAPQIFVVEYSSAT
jgi:hypothetical protein